jgi:predicted metal-dependent hydrolase
LVLAPPKVFEYVIVHELCHIQHKNPAAGFWDLVGRLMLDYKPQRLWLKRHGAELMMGAC